MQPSSPIVIGMIGGVASGKSSVGRELEALGAKRLDADAVGHEALAAPEVIVALTQTFGDQILDPSGAIDRKALAEQAFASPEKVKQLNGITHPWIRKQMSERLAALKAEDGLPAIILDVSLLLESGAYDDEWDLLLFVDAPRDERLQRAINLRGWTPQDLEKRESHQWPVDKKRASATHVIENAGPLAELKEKVAAFWRAAVEPRAEG